MRTKIIEYLKCKSMDEIIEACNDIYEYRYITGVLAESSIIRKMAKETNFFPRDICDAIEIYAGEKLRKTVKLLLLQRPFEFIRL